MDESESIGLPEAIRSLRAELSEAMKEGEHEDVRFRLGPVELEFSVAVSREGGGTAGVKFYVITLGAEGKASRATTHRITLTLSPVDAEGKDLEVGGRVSGKPL